MNQYNRLHRIILPILFLLSPSLKGQVIDLALPSESYSVSPDGHTLWTWKGMNATLNMSLDPVLRGIDTIASGATYYLDSLGHVAGFPFLEELLLPPTLKHIASGAFYCPYLKKISFNSGLESLEQWALFDGIYTELHLPSTLRDYAEGAIVGRAINEIHVAEGSEYLSVQDRCLVDLRHRTLLLYPSGTLEAQPSLPTEVIRIGRYAFAMSPYVTHLQIPKGVTSIGQDAFRDCSSLITLDLPRTITQLEGLPWVGSPLDTLIIRSVFPPHVEPQTIPLGIHPLHLYVPQEAIHLYTQSPFWQKVARRIESISDLEDVRMALPSEHRPYRLVGNTLMLNLPTNSTARLYDKEGTLLKQWTSSASYTLSQGVYLLQIGNESYKITL